MRLKDKVAVITGGGSGIGRGIARCMAREGARVVVADARFESAKTVALEIRTSGGEAEPVGVDVRYTAQIERMFQAVLLALDHVDILVNNAGIASPVGLPFTNLKDDDWDDVYDVNVKGIFRTCKAFAPYFKERRYGRIINIGSIAGPMAGFMKPPYSVSKASVIAFSRLLAKELASHGVTVNVINPGFLWTPFWQNLAEELIKKDSTLAGKTPCQVFEKRMRELTPMGVPQEPEDIGHAAVFLASDEARFVTGQSLFVDGGVSCNIIQP